MCEFRIQDCRHSPWEGLPQMAPWHHVGATMEITLDKNGSLYDPAGTESWNMQIRNCDNRANVSCSSLGFLAWPLAILENSSGRYAELIRLCIPYNQVASLDVVPDCMPRPWLYATSPCTRLKKGEDRRKKKREILHLFRCYTHTHTRPEPGQPWKARGRKKRTHEGQKAKNSAGGGGEQTDLRNQPTRRNGPDQNSAHT